MAFLLTIPAVNFEVNFPDVCYVRDVLKLKRANAFVSKKVPYLKVCSKKKSFTFMKLKSITTIAKNDLVFFIFDSLGTEIESSDDRMRFCSYTSYIRLQ